MKCKQIVNQISGAQYSAHPSAAADASARSSGLQGDRKFVHIVRWSIVCGWPHVQRSEPAWYPHLTRFVLHRPVLVRSRFKVFHVVQCSSEPGGRCSSADISISLSRMERELCHISFLVMTTELVNGGTDLRKLRRDLSLALAASLPYNG